MKENNNKKNTRMTTTMDGDTDDKYGMYVYVSTTDVMNSNTTLLTEQLCSLSNSKINNSKKGDIRIKTTTTGRIQE